MIREVAKIRAVLKMQKSTQRQKRSVSCAIGVAKATS
jgi:hypothetical protein